MTDRVTCKECKKVVSTKHAISTTFMGDISTKYTRCLDCHEEFEDRIRKEAQDSHDALVARYGHEDIVLKRMNERQLKDYEDIKEKIKKMRENV